MSSFNMSMKEPNATLSYSAGSATYTAKVRISMAGYVYGVTSTESHSRTNRAFYPHRRALGQFSITVDCIGYKEHRLFQNWLRAYVDTLFTGQMGNQRGATLMEVQMTSRNFHKYGILTTGIDDHDHVGSMVFSPTLTFMTLKDFNDAGTAIVSTKSISSFSSPKVQSDYLADFPVTSSSYKDTDDTLYGQSTIDPIDTIISTPPPTIGGTGPVSRKPQV